jgi:hypothetical protein
MQYLSIPAPANRIRQYSCTHQQVASELCSYLLIHNVNQSFILQGNHSNRLKRLLKRPETTMKRRITALNFFVFRRNTSARFTSRFFARRRPPFSPAIFVVLRADVKRRRNTPIFAILHRLRCRFYGPVSGNYHHISFIMVLSCGQHGFQRMGFLEADTRLPYQDG